MSSPSRGDFQFQSSCTRLNPIWQKKCDICLQGISRRGRGGGWWWMEIEKHFSTGFAEFSTARSWIFCFNCRSSYSRSWAASSFEDLQSLKQTKKERHFCIMAIRKNKIWHRKTELSVNRHKTSSKVRSGNFDAVLFLCSVFLWEKALVHPPNEWQNPKYIIRQRKNISSRFFLFLLSRLRVVLYAQRKAHWAREPWWEKRMA